MTVPGPVFWWPTIRRRKKKHNFPSGVPRELDAEILRFKNNEEDWIAFIGLLDGKPYEIFTGRKEEDTFPIPSKVTKGKDSENQRRGWIQAL